MSLVIGMNSGSSFDGIDVVLVRIDIGSDGQPTKPEVVKGIGHEWPEAVSKLVLRAFANDLSIFELTRLNYLAGAVFAEAAMDLMDRAGVSSDEVGLIGVDGQTIYQEPPSGRRLGEATVGPLHGPRDIVSYWLDGEYGCGLQIGEPAVIASFCDIPVVWNFRPSDHALGGTGAPLMQYLDFVAFRELGPILTLNIGGIANCQLAHSDRSKMMAFDTGPGNVMIDYATRKLLQIPYDRGGSIASGGEINSAMLARLQEHPFFLRKPPRSAWRLDFGEEYASRILAEWSNLATTDLLATLTDFTAWSIVRSIEDNVSMLDDISVLIASGGGVFNDFLMSRLRSRFGARLEVAISDAFGIPAKYKEAVKFATLAFAYQNRLANNIPAASGAAKFTVMGKMVLPPRMARMSYD